MAGRTSPYHGKVGFVSPQSRVHSESPWRLQSCAPRWSIGCGSWWRTRMVPCGRACRSRSHSIQPRADVSHVVVSFQCAHQVLPRDGRLRRWTRLTGEIRAGISPVWSGRMARAKPRCCGSSPVCWFPIRAALSRLGRDPVKECGRDSIARSATCHRSSGCMRICR